VRPFALEQPTSIAEAIGILAANPDARLLAGGTDLIIRLRDGTIRTDTVVDVKRIRELDAAIDETAAGGLSIGARAAMTEIAENPLVRTRYTALAEGALVVGSVQIRNRATLAGNVCNASPAADTAPALLVFGAELVARGPHGERRIALDDFFVRSGVTTLRPGEIVARIDVPPLPGAAGSTHERRTRRRGHDLASVTVACAVLDSGETRLAFGSVGPRPVLQVDTSGVLADADAPEGERLRILEAMLADASPSSGSMRASPDYRLAMLRVLAERALRTARARRANGSAA
jgi:carbon-monoxide dehydrogenase medium subunit